MPIFCQLISEFWWEIWKWLKGHFWSVAKAVLRIWCGTLNSNLESYLVYIYWTLNILTLISFRNDWLMARAIRAKCFVKCSTTTIAKIIETFKWVQVVITDAISYQIGNSSTLVIVKSWMFKSWQEVPIELHVSTLTPPPPWMDKACIPSIFIKTSQFFLVKADINCRLVD